MTSAASSCPGRPGAPPCILYCGEWIESHALHVQYMLHAPDFLGYDGAVELARDEPAAVERGLALKKTGNEVLALIGGREIHPINVRVGGFYRAHAPRAARTLIEPLERAREASLATVRWTAGFEFPERAVECELVAPPSPASMRSSAAGSSPTAGSTSAPPSTTSTSSRSTSSARTRSTRRSDGGTYLCGPLARYALNGAALAARARGGARGGGGAAVPRRFPQHRRAERGAGVRLRRGAAPDRGLRRAGGPVRPRGAGGRGSATASARRRAASSITATGSTRTGRSWTRRSCRRRPRTSWRSRPTSAPSWSATPASRTRSRWAVCEQAIRNYDPCISCATHFLDLQVEGMRTVVIGVGNAFRGRRRRRPCGRRARSRARARARRRRVRAGAAPAARHGQDGSGAARGRGLFGGRARHGAPARRDRRACSRDRLPGLDTRSASPRSPSSGAHSTGCPNGCSCSGSRARRSAQATRSPRRWRP